MAKSLGLSEDQQEELRRELPKQGRQLTFQELLALAKELFGQ